MWELRDSPAWAWLALANNRPQWPRAKTVPEQTHEALDDGSLILLPSQGNAESQSAP